MRTNGSALGAMARARGNLGRRRDQSRLDQARAGDEAEMRHLGGEAGEVAGAGDKRGAPHEGAAAVLAAEQSRAFEIAERVADGDAAHAEHGAKLVLGGDTAAGRPFAVFDALAYRLLDLMPERLGPAPVELGEGDRLAHRRRHQSGAAAAATAAPTRAAPAPKAPTRTSMPRRCGGRCRRSASRISGMRTSAERRDAAGKEHGRRVEQRHRPGKRSAERLRRRGDARRARGARRARAAAMRAAPSLKPEHAGGAVEGPAGGDAFEPAAPLVAGIVDIGARPAEGAGPAMRAADDPAAGEHRRADAGADRRGGWRRQDRRRRRAVASASRAICASLPAATGRPGKTPARSSPSR